MQFIDNGTLRNRVLALLGAIALGLPGLSAQAQSYPDKPLHLIIPFAPGGSTDVMGRNFAAEFPKYIGQPVIVENKVGAAGAIGGDFVAKSAPDGYTLCYCGAGSSFMVEVLGQKTAYSAERDLIPVSLSHTIEYLLAVKPSLPIKNLAEYVAYAKANPGKVSYSTPGTAGPNHLGMVLLEQVAGISLLHVPYKGEAPAMADLAGGQVDSSNSATFITAPAYLKAGKIRAIAHMAATRAPQMPDLPTVAEQGYPGFESVTFVGIMVAAGTPQPIVKKLQDNIMTMIKTPAVRDKMIEMGVRPVGSTAEEHAAFLKRERDKAARIVRVGNIKAE